MTINNTKQKPLPEVLLGKSIEQLTEWVQQQGQPTYRAQQLHEWLYKKNVRSLVDISVLPKTWRANLRDDLIGRSTIAYQSVAPDKTRKYLLRLSDGLIIETVGIPTSKRLTACVSSQVGCPMDCDFCATGKGGFTRNLLCHEIVDQVLTLQEDFGQRVTNIVFMGMGEPLLNLKEVVAAIKTINIDVGIGQRSLTLSTVGLPNKILEFAQHKLQVTFAVSLHASNQKLREKLIPSANHYPLNQLLDECREYVNITGRRVTFEYILLSGVNDLPENAQELVKHLKGFQSHVNLIPYNPIQEADYQRPNKSQIEQFMNVLEKANIAVSIRHSRGLATDAACGQLRASSSN